jgi:hypothetical protein
MMPLKLGKVPRVAGPTAQGPGDDDDGYASPNFDDLDLPSGSDDDAPVYQSPLKKQKPSFDTLTRNGRNGIEDDELLALQMLRAEA